MTVRKQCFLDTSRHPYELTGIVTALTRQNPSMELEADTKSYF